MKKLSVVIVSLCYLLCQYAVANDTDYQADIIGVWVMGAEDEHFGKDWFTIEYKADGTTVYKTYQSAKCETPRVVVYGSWAIKNGKLINVALSGSDGYKVPLGLTFVDNIITLKDGEMVLQTDKGHTAYRSKNGPCG